MDLRAVLSVSDKQGIVEFAKGLTALGIELISTGGTYKTLIDANIPVTYVSEVTGFPEIMEGRVKTLHPKIHGGILARDCDEHRKQAAENEIQFIDLVVVNLYPFKETIVKPGVSFAEAIENIDIGGPTMVRAAAKNQERVTIIVDPKSYNEVLDALQKEGKVPAALRQRLAAEAFAHTAEYDRLIAGYLEQQLDPGAVFPLVIRLSANKVQDLRYGENPQQHAALYAALEEGTLASGKQMQGKELSYNNWMDMDVAWAIVGEFPQQCATVIIKHANPCGAALGATPIEAYQRALETDPVTASGGIVAFNRVVDGACARSLSERYFEGIVAPEFDQEAYEILGEKLALRLYAVGCQEPGTDSSWKIKSVNGGYLVQEEDRGKDPASEWKLVTYKKPTANDLQELEFAWQVVKHIKSNAIVVSRNKQAIGIGAGQMNRDFSVNIALNQAGRQVNGAYLASDAFFPSPESLEEAAKAGIRAIVQPGGSVRDKAVIDAANNLNMIMLLTNRRYFQH
ncbi:MAG: bifunctional phosphoribosylaminoimidazolecarboxamide formyltransferase/IMP cyclohydrolase [Desulfitobacteriaceae bacterium]|nr:bifunctional phosphoribosylaminoimidazolecarboxamide formyltransferase/IMP cyclohydrolase [Desulfitobacteriaceae bacterium]MDD4346213.1 bifunctional phosphoribosylaminoimidazolecarboxamide formyltransferase/IMP cyclohydrolase [Desulfitobacteriaceae bacterium]MDD4400851.1 bifunctional phosphoribosylaminoimidazolecarboxamide formyltransferase/IMP cyclohydrolase [Desulfitobacteriaceae bacterium]